MSALAVWGLKGKSYMTVGNENSLVPVTVTVIMPVYNAERYVAEAVRSVLAQTYGEWELLIIDDGSTDRTAAIAEDFAKADPRVRLIRNRQNMGVAYTRNKGLDMARGAWVALLDGDDVWHSGKLEKQLALSEKAEADILYCSYAMTDRNGVHRSDYIVPETTSYEAMLRKNVLSCSTVMLSRRIAESYRFPVNCYHEDYAYWLMLLRNGYKAAACREVLVDYRVVKGSRSGNKIRSAKQRWRVYRKIEGLPLGKSIHVFLSYAYCGLVKHGKREK